MKNQKAKEMDIHQEALEFLRIGNEAVRAAQEENRRLGIPNAYSHNGRLYYELPNGELTLEDPFREDDSESGRASAAGD